MNITRNTKLFKASSDAGNEVIFRTLNVNELALLDSIKSVYHKHEMAYKIAVEKPNDNMNFFEVQQVGRDIVSASMLTLSNPDMLELTVDEFRGGIEDDPILTLITHIIGTLPNTSIEYLLNQTYEDLIELAVLCEKISNKKIFNSGSLKTQPKQDIEIKEDKSFFKDDGKSLQDKMKEMADF